MPNDNIDQAKKIIAKLELADPNFKLRGNPDIFHTEDASESTASVIGNGIFTFTKNVSAQHREDIENACSLAYLSSLKKHNFKANKAETENFFNFYTDEVLAKIGFLVTSFQFSKHDVSGATFSVDKAVIDILKAIVSENDAALVESTLKALEALADNDDDKFKLFSTHSHDAENSSFLISLVDEQNGEVAIKLGAFYFHTDQNNKKFLWFSYATSSSTLFKATQTASLNEPVYSHVRQEVIEKLTGVAGDTVARLEV